jgi:serpin B
MKISSFLQAATMLLALGCFMQLNGGARAEVLQAAVSANNAFAFDLYLQLAKTPGNLFFSPFSAESSLALACAGAKGQTRDQMARVLHLGASNFTDQAFGALNRRLSDDQQLASDMLGEDAMQGIPFQLHVANSMWGQQQFRFRDDYLKIAKDDYGASLRLLDFKSAPESARQQINNWVAQQTREKIQNIIPDGALSEATRLVLANAIYFKARWRVQFEKSRTTGAPFYTDPRRAISTPTMNGQSEAGYAEAQGVRLLELPYFSRKMSMLILLPADIAALEKSFSAQWLADALAKIQPRQVNVFLPKFKIDSDFSLVQPLRTMGMLDAFSDTADFSAIASGTLFINAVLQKAYIDVDEGGTEATAATVVASAAGGLPEPPPPIVMKIDHPFIFLLRHNGTGAILFMGRVTTPSAR